ncbi:MAG: LacI family DNA-binding transcriptional regulator [Bifidobacteriaceae bacterium]|nr:LacI family DNA-binding transcriptional regulator [Bifidobacteriaceae bacterium]
MGYVTIKDIALSVGISVGAVSQIMHNKGRFSEATKKQVFQIADELGYIPDERARSMRMLDRHKIVGILTPDLRNPYFAELISKMEEDLNGLNISSLIGTSSESSKKQKMFLANLLGQRIDGALIIPQGNNAKDFNLLIQSGLPFVFVDRRISKLSKVPAVLSDPRPGLSDALKHLAKCGHQKVAFISHRCLESETVNAREHAFVELSSKMNKGRYSVINACRKHSYEELYAQLVKKNISAVICAYSPDAIELIRVIHQNGMLVGDKMSLISFDSIPVFEQMSPSVAVIDQQIGKIAKAGVAMMYKLITGEHLEENIVYVPTVYCARESVGLYQ